MTDSFEQPDENQLREFLPSLDDPDLSQLELELADRLVARPALLDRGSILHEAGWKAALEAKQEQEQIAASTLLAVSTHSLSDSTWSDLLNWTGAIALVTVIGITVILFTNNQADETTIADTEVTSPIESFEQPVVTEDQSFIVAESESVTHEEPASSVYSRNRFLGATEEGRRLYRAGAGGFTHRELEALLTDKPTPLIKNDDDAAVSSSNSIRVPLRDPHSEPPEPTAFNLMREWAIYGPAAD